MTTSHDYGHLYTVRRTTTDGGGRLQLRTDASLQDYDSPHTCVLQREPAITDSGSNVDICTEVRARQLEKIEGIEVQWGDMDAEGYQARYVHFAALESKERVIGMVRGGGLLRKMRIVKNLTDSLVSVHTFAQRGMTVRYHKDTVTIEDE
jgi:hypothetical protein